MHIDRCIFVYINESIKNCFYGLLVSPKQKSFLYWEYDAKLDGERNMCGSQIMAIVLMSWNKKITGYVLKQKKEPKILFIKFVEFTWKK